MNKLQKTLLTLILWLPLVVSAVWYNPLTWFPQPTQPAVILGGPVSNIFNNVIPSANQTYDLGTTTPTAEWKNIYTKNLTVSGTCTGCGSGGGAFAWTPTTWGGLLANSTSTPIQFLAGEISATSSVGTLTAGAFTATSSITLLGASTGCATFTTGVLSSTGVACGSGAGGAFPFTPTIYGAVLANATSTLLNFTQGFMSTASSTISSSLNVSGGLTVGTLAGVVGANSGSLYAVASSSIFGYTPLNPTRALTVAGTANQITSSAGSQDLSADRTWTLSFPNHVIFPVDFVASAASTTNATSTNLTISNNLIVPTTSALLKTDANGAVSGYAGITCTNQFVRSLSVLGAATCNSVANTDLVSSSITINTSGNLSGGNSVALGSSLTLTSPFSWTPTTNFAQLANGTSTQIWLQGSPISLSASSTSIFQNASSTQFTASSKLYIPASAIPSVTTAGDIAINTTQASSSVRYYDGIATRSLFPTYDKTFSFASSTLIYSGAFGTSGTTTILLSNSYRPTTLISFYCKAPAGGTAWVGFGNGSATTTESNCSGSGVEVNPATNNTRTMRQNFYIEIGRSANTPSWITVTATFRDDSD